MVVLCRTQNKHLTIEVLVMSYLKNLGELKNPCLHEVDNIKKFCTNVRMYNRYTGTEKYILERNSRTYVHFYDCKICGVEYMVNTDLWGKRIPNAKQYEIKYGG